MIPRSREAEGMARFMEKFVYTVGALFVAFATVVVVVYWVVAMLHQYPKGF